MCQCRCQRHRLTGPLTVCLLRSLVALRCARMCVLAAACYFSFQAARAYFAFDGNTNDVLASICLGIFDDEQMYLDAMDTMCSAASVVSAFIRMSTEVKYPVE